MRSDPSASEETMTSVAAAFALRAAAAIAGRMRSMRARNGASDSSGNFGGTRWPLTPMRRLVEDGLGWRAGLTAVDDPGSTAGPGPGPPKHSPEFRPRERLSRSRRRGAWPCHQAEFAQTQRQRGEQERNYEIDDAKRQQRGEQILFGKLRQSDEERRFDDTEASRHVTDGAEQRRRDENDKHRHEIDRGVLR